MELCITNSCNLSCKYCFCKAGRDYAQTGNMSEEIAFKAIDLLLKNSKNKKKLNVAFFGGEPLMNYNLIYSVVKYAKHQSNIHNKIFSFSITTNATLLNEEFVNFMIENNFNIMISADGPKQYHNYQCPTKNNSGSYDKMFNGLSLLINKNFPIDIRTTVASPGIELKTLIEWYNSLHALGQFIIEPAKNYIDSPSEIDISEKQFCKKIICSNHELKNILDYMKKHNGNTPPYFPFYHAWQSINNPKYSQYYTCNAGINRCYVASDGTIYPCALLAGKKDWNIGSVYNGIDHQKSLNMWKKYRLSVANNCQKCWAIGICRPSMPCDVIKNDGSFYKKHRFCKLIKKRIEQASYLYYNYNNTDI